MPKKLNKAPATSSVIGHLQSNAAAAALAPVAPEPVEEDVPQPKAVVVEEPSPKEAPPPVRPAPPKAQPQPPEPVQPPAPTPRLMPKPTGEPADVISQLVLTPSTDEVFGRLTDLYKTSTGSKPTKSHIARALLSAIDAAWDGIQAEAQTIGRLKRPPNSPGKEVLRDLYEQAIGENLLRGLRRKGS